MLDWFFRKFGYVKRAELSGVCIGIQAQQELDFIYEKTGYRAHRVSPEHQFNAFMKIANNPEAENVERLMHKYAAANYVFTEDFAVLFGNVCSISTKDDRVALRRSNIKLVPLSDQHNEELESPS